MTVRAFEVTDARHEVGEVVFAETPAKAKKESAIYGSGEYGWVELRARRMAPLDQYATQGFVTDRQLHEHGYTVYCSRCVEAIWEPDDELVFVNDRAYHAGCAARTAAPDAAPREE
jgi:hypothetical protein